MSDAASNGHGTPREPTIGEQLGLGPHWTPTTVSWGWRKLGTPAGPIHVLLMYTPTGVTGYALTEDDMRRFISRALSEQTGLVLPEPGAPGVPPAPPG